MILTIASAVPSAFAGEADASEPFSRDEALAISQAAIGRSLAAYDLIDLLGEPFSLASLRGRPVVLSLIFTSCHHTCPMLTRNLDTTVQIAREALGGDSFSVVTVGFDWQNDTPGRMGDYAREMGVDPDRWHFLSGSEAGIMGLTKDIGFIFYPSPRGFDHLAQTTIIDADGKVFWQVYGAGFKAPQLVEPLKRLVFQGRHEPLSLKGWIDGVKFFCTVYDPSSGRYQFDYSIFVAFLAGLLSLGAVAVFIVRAWRQST